MGVVKEKKVSGSRSSKSCGLCERRGTVDYKDPGTFRKYLDEQGKILSRMVTGNCAVHQREVTLAVKRSRELGL